MTLSRTAEAVSRHAGEAIENEAAGDRDVEARALSDHRDLHADVRSVDVFLGGAVPFVA